MWYLKCFITPAECVHLLNGVLTSINKEVISAAIYNLMDAKVSVKFLVLQQHYLIWSIGIFLTPNQWRFCLCFTGNARAGEYLLPFQVHSEIVECLLWGSLDNQSIATCYFKNKTAFFYSAPGVRLANPCEWEQTSVQVLQIRARTKDVFFLYVLVRNHLVQTKQHLYLW